MPRTKDTSARSISACRKGMGTGNCGYALVLHEVGRRTDGERPLNSASVGQGRFVNAAETVESCSNASAIVVADRETALRLTVPLAHAAPEGRVVGPVAFQRPDRPG